MFQDLLAGFKGDAGHLRRFMESPAWRAGMAFSLKSSPEYQKLRDFKDPTGQALSVGLGQISAGGARGIQDSIGQLNQMGLGRNAGLVGAVRQQGQLDTSSRSAAFQSDMAQRIGANERQRLGQMLEMEQAMQQLAMGFSPQPRTPSSGPSTGDYLGLIGTIGGGLLGGPIGAGAGSQLGRLGG